MLLSVVAAESAVLKHEVKRPNKQHNKALPPTVYSPLVPQGAINIFREPSESQVKILLAESNLPTSDLLPEHLEHFFGCGTAEMPGGVVGLEILGNLALLRSLAVAVDCRGIGCGKALVAEAERYAQSQGVTELYLLTTTAGRFFERLGYQRASRDTAPTPIRETQEFAALCPSRSAFLVKGPAG